MALQTNEVTPLKGPTETHVDDLTIPKLRFAPTDAQIQESPEEFPIDAANDNAKTFETRYSDRDGRFIKDLPSPDWKNPTLNSSRRNQSVHQD